MSRKDKKAKTDADAERAALKARFIEALGTLAGIVSAACKKVGIDRQTYYNWKASDAEFAARVKDADENAKDFVESKLFDQINKGNIVAIIFYLKTKAKDRGYVERAESEFSGAVKVELVKVVSERRGDVDE